MAFALRLAAVLWLSDTTPYSDFYYYNEAAKHAAQDVGFFFDRTAAERFAKLGWWPPGYPMFLSGIYAVLGPNHRLAAMVQVFLGTFVCWLVYRIGGRAAGERVGLLAALLVAVDPTYVFTTNLMAAENLFVVWFALGLWLAGRTWQSTRPQALTGVVLALGTLVRAVGLGVPVIVVAWLRGRVPGPVSWRTAAAWLLGAYVLTIAPWTLRNAIVAGNPALVCFGGGLNFYFGHNDQPQGYRDLKDTPMAGLKTAAEIDRRGYRAGLQHVVQHPLTTLTATTGKIGALFAPPGWALHSQSAVLYNGVVLIADTRADPRLARLGSPVVDRQAARDRHLHGILLWLAGVHSYFLLAGALLACLGFWRRLPAEMRLAAWVSAYWVVSHVVFWAQPRFRYPMEIPFALLAAWALALGLRRTRRAAS